MTNQLSSNFVLANLIEAVAPGLSVCYLLFQIRVANIEFAARMTQLKLS